MIENYPRKCWYVAASSEELSDNPLGRRLLGRDIVLWRTSKGQATAFVDRCAHRGFPLSHGRVQNDLLVCGYHGCSYRTDGVCVHIPTQHHVPFGMSLRALQIREDPPFIWIWPGPPAGAASIRPPRMPWLTDPAWTTFSKSWLLKANFLMAHEHYLDFSYAPVVHREDLPPGIERLPSFADIEVTEATVSYTRLLPEAPLAKWEADAAGLDGGRGYRRSETGTFASPAIHIQRWEIEADSERYSHIRTHGITPETGSSTHIFMHVSRNYSPGRAAVTMSLRSFVDGLVRRDSEILEMAAARAGYEGWRSGLEFQADAAVLRARRIVAVMLAKEMGRSPLRPGLAERANPTSRLVTAESFAW